MTPVLLVELNRGELHNVEAPAEFSTSEAFSVELRNHGEAVHVHLRADDPLSAVARIDSDGNVFVEHGTTQSVPVSVGDVGSPVTGSLEISTGYGAEGQSIAVTVEPESEENEVDVDETLSRPPNADQNTETVPIGERFETLIPSRRTASLVLLGILAIAVAAAVASAVQSTAVLIGTGVVVGAVLAALVMAFR
ncbi:DUF7524 family protein [Haloplanus halobius]|uniref:DUF7524 family protein n=1 Tax=Haloplanus halobius TaxID=2934938 RepID=UPI00200C6E8D|nr:hypothetical protein [Haloplanus sp. XH21]